MDERVPCPCCGYRTLPDGPGAYELCEVCGWEDDGVSTERPLVWGGNPNGISLAEAQRRFQRYGSIYPNSRRSRPPRPDEARERGWKPVDDPTADRYRDFVDDLAYLVVQAAEAARDEARRRGDEYARGRLDASRDAIELLMRQAEAFGMSVADIGLPEGVDPSVDFSPDPPTGRYAG
jgi:hypothetical protein